MINYEDMIEWGAHRLRPFPMLPRQSDFEGATAVVVRLPPVKGRDRRSRDLAELNRALLNPAAVFPSPEDVVQQPSLSIECKRAILARWAWDEYLIDLAAAEGMGNGEPSRLAEVKAALRALDRGWSPDPAAPAAFPIRLEVDHSLAA